MEKTTKLSELFIAFAKVGVMTFGGGYAMLPILQREIVERKKWATEGELADYFAIGQCTPGIIAVNTATFIGKKEKGILGGIMATLGVVFPSVVIITILAGVIQSFSELEWVSHAFAGIRVAVCVLIFNAILKLLVQAVHDMPAGIIYAVVAVLAYFIDVSPVVFVLAAAVAGIIIKMIGGPTPNATNAPGGPTPNAPGGSTPNAPDAPEGPTRETSKAGGEK